MNPKPSEWTRIMVQNTNGVSIGKDGDFPITLDHIKQMDVHIMIITETNLDTTHTRVKALLHNDLRRMLGLATYHLIASASPQPYNSFYKPGGVLGIVNGKTKGRIIESGSDYMGRWIYLKLQGQGQQIVTIIGTYQVCQNNVRNTGPTAAIVQQYSIMAQEGRPNPHQV
jgi:hypothetical protein